MLCIIVGHDQVVQSVALGKSRKAVAIVVTWRLVYFSLYKSNTAVLS